MAMQCSTYGPRHHRDQRAEHRQRVPPERQNRRRRQAADGPGGARVLLQHDARGDAAGRRRNRPHELRRRRRDDREVPLGQPPPGRRRRRRGTEIPNAVELHTKIDRIRMGTFKYLLDRWKTYSTPNGPLLDNAFAMWTSHVANGPSHSFNNLPIIIAGSAGGYLKQGQYVDGAARPTASSSPRWSPPRAAAATAPPTRRSRTRQRPLPDRRLGPPVGALRPATTTLDCGEQARR